MLPVGVLMVDITKTGVVTVPVKVGEASGAFNKSTMVTNSVVAICVEFVPGAAVGADGTPVNVGEADKTTLDVEVPVLFVA